jgi:hypothetical protein
LSLTLYTKLNQMFVIWLKNEILHEAEARKTKNTQGESVNALSVPLRML